MNYTFKFQAIFNLWTLADLGFYQTALIYSVKFKAHDDINTLIVRCRKWSIISCLVMMILAAIAIHNVGLFSFIAEPWKVIWIMGLGLCAGLSTNLSIWDGLGNIHRSLIIRSIGLCLGAGSGALLYPLYGIEIAITLLLAGHFFPLLFLALRAASLFQGEEEIGRLKKQGAMNGMGRSMSKMQFCMAISGLSGYGVYFFPVLVAGRYLTAADAGSFSVLFNCAIAVCSIGTAPLQQIAPYLTLSTRDDARVIHAIKSRIRMSFLICSAFFAVIMTIFTLGLVPIFFEFKATFNMNIVLFILFLGCLAQCMAVGYALYVRIEGEDGFILSSLTSALSLIIIISMFDLDAYGIAISWSIAVVSSLLPCVPSLFKTIQNSHSK